MKYITVVYHGPFASGRSSSIDFVRKRLIGATEYRKSMSGSGTHLVEFTVSNSEVTIAVLGMVGNVGSFTAWHEGYEKADAIVLVLDSQRFRFEANADECSSVEQSVLTTGELKPMVLQFNKRDITTSEWSVWLDGRPTVHSDAQVSLEEMSRTFNRWGVAEFGSSLVSGEGVFEAFEAAALLAARAKHVQDEVRILIEQSRLLRNT